MTGLLVLSDLESCVDAVLARVGQQLKVGTPLGIGKPNHLVNTLYRRARQDSSIRLTIMTALSLNRPVGKSDLERRFLGPFVERVFGDYPDLDYLRDLEGRRLPSNVEISEFYFKSGGLLGNAHAQQHYVSSNYTHVVRDMLAAGVNVILQMVAKQERHGRVFYSLSGNPDLTLDILLCFSRQGSSLHLKQAASRIAGQFLTALNERGMEGRGAQEDMRPA